MPIPHLRQQCQWNGYSEWLLKNRIFHTLFCKVYFSGSERHLFTSIAGRPREDFVSVFTTCMSWVLSVLLLKTSVYIVNVMLWPIQYVWWCFLWPCPVDRQSQLSSHLLIARSSLYVQRAAAKWAFLLLFSALCFFRKDNPYKNVSVPFHICFPFPSCNLSGLFCLWYFVVWGFTSDCMSRCWFRSM